MISVEYPAVHVPGNRFRALAVICRAFLVTMTLGGAALCLSESRGAEKLESASKATSTRVDGRDPVQIWLEQRLEQVLACFQESDADQDGEVSIHEWPAAPLKNISSDLASLPGKAWDKNGDGMVVADECRHLLEISYGIRRPDGSLIRTSAGGLVDCIYIRAADKDKDGFLSFDEFVESYWAGSKEKNTEVFKSLDKDNDNRLSFAEIAANPALNTTIDQLFAVRDKNSDGYLDREELVASGAVWQRRVALRTIPAFDDDGDGRLSRIEFGASPLANYSSDFYTQRTDIDGDGKLSWPEFLSEKSPYAIELYREYFRRFDRDRNGSLSQDELDFVVEPNRARQTATTSIVAAPKSKGAASPDRSLAVDDPIGRWMERRLSQLLEMFRELDDDQDGRLPRGEWPPSKANEVDRDLYALPRTAWDRNSDGAIDADECRELLEIAYGIRRPDGAVLRTPTGGLVDCLFIRNADKDSDGFLSLDEFSGSYWAGGREQNAVIFRQLDKDNDSRLSFAEAAANPALNTTIGQMFAARDKNSDGYLDREEAVSGGPKWQQNVASRVIPAFDDNRDGRLSPSEFGGTPLANYSSDFYRQRKDANDDGQLSWEEFYSEKNPFAIAVCREYFSRFDRDHNEILSLDELDFLVDANKVAVEVAFKVQDQNRDGRLDLNEVFSEQKPSQADALALERYELRLAAAENKFMSADSDANGSLNLEEFTRSRQAAMEMAKRHSDALAQRDRLLGGSYWARKGVFVVNEFAILYGAWLILRRKPKRVSTT
jgi:Ca2+-binding EF-hand superfamily protein